MVSTRSSKRPYDSTEDGKDTDKKEGNRTSDDDASKKRSTKRSKRTPAKPKPEPTAKETEIKKTMSVKDADIPKFVDKILKEAGIEYTKTQNGWCLKEAMIHVLKADNGRIFPLVEQHGAPKIFASIHHCKNSTGKTAETSTEPKNCFESLCRIVAGQQLAGAAASAMWTRLLKTAGGKLTPKKVLELVEKGGMEEGLRKPAGLSNAKARSIVNIAQSFLKGDLSESFLRKSEQQKIREELIKIKGIGPWSCDMFCMFFLELPDVFPVGDLAVRNGMKKFFNLKGSDRNGYLCQKKDLAKMTLTLKPFAPYRSVIASYMWKVTDTKDVYHSKSDSKSQPKPPQKKKRKYQVLPSSARR